MDLYDKSVDQVYADQVYNTGRNLAQRIGMHYASTELGGTPEELLNEYFGYVDMLSSSGFDPRYIGYALKDGDGNVLASRDLDGNYTTHLFEVTGQYMHLVDTVSLTPTEYAILRLLMQNPGKVFSTKILYESVWQEAALGSEGAVAVHIRHLREKIEINPSEPRYLKVVWGQGYKMEGGNR